MIIILDASAAVEIILQRQKGRALHRYIEDADWILAPGLFIAEVTNVFWKYYQLGDMSLEQCEKAVEYAIALPDEYSNDLTLYRESFSLGGLVGKPVFDMFYLVLARRNNGYLITLDKKLMNIAKDNSIRIIE
ncbi:MAG: type II toxin-antitoxin system VapC family toxin [Desulfobacteraceae bacterium]|nr:type II toxin-antitoxin system VapC family toxin [Desulfobacteraceae bacterium]MBC2754643.1 type II toxin-antitoxin system VapC family toxin [Desulfobacteraceae bacterium]